MAYREMWEIEVRHDGLGKYRHIRGADRHVVEQKAQAQHLAWEEQWQRKLDAERRKGEVERARSDKNRQRQAAERVKEEAEEYRQSRLEEAVRATEEALAALSAVRDLLAHTLAVDDAIQWESLKDNRLFSEEAPKLQLAILPDPPRRADFDPKVLRGPSGLLDVPVEPVSSDPAFAPKLGFIRGLFSLPEKIDAMREAAWKSAHDAWVQEKERVETRNESMWQIWRDKQRVESEKRFEDAVREWDMQKTSVEQRNAAARLDHDKATASYQERKDAFCASQAEANAAIDAQRERYLAGDAGAVIDYCEMVLANSAYPDIFPREWDLECQPDAKLLIVDYQMPSPDMMPTIEEVKYFASKDEMKESHLSEKAANALYDDALYQIALRTLHEIFEADRAKNLGSVVFNGYVTAINAATGNVVTACILSVQASRDEFLSINLAKVTPRACFKTLKGVGSTKLHGITAVPPIATIDKEDRRFVTAYGVADTLDDSSNLAAMDWEDFEHLIREVFEKEFSGTGGEVKVTQASRDGGVDAVAFDPDPIRGGKIVIQAKRYTNTVGVSAVRDLYGTVMNEGATKGILVTTANYGPDAYDFAKGKPLTLLNGANLLHLLGKHGHRARIDLAEARKIQLA